MNANFESHLKRFAISSVKSFKGFKPNKIKVISNSPKYPNSVTLSMDIYCDPFDGYIFYNAATNEQYAMTASEVSSALSSMIDNKKCWKPNSRYTNTDLLRLTFDSIQQYKI